MAIEKTLGGDRLGAGKKQKIYLNNYERSTHDLGYLFRTTMSAGTLVPFMCEVALPGDTFDINLNCDIKTHPTVGPLFGSFKVQLDVFLAPIRLYQAKLHNNKLGIGMNMSQVKLPQITLSAPRTSTEVNSLDNTQINPSCILPYLGIRGIGINNLYPGAIDRTFNAVPLLAYWEIYKNYYANKSEEIGAVIHDTSGPVNKTVTSIGINGVVLSAEGSASFLPLGPGSEITVQWSGTAPKLNDIYIDFVGTNLADQPLSALTSLAPTYDGFEITIIYDHARWGSRSAENWRYRNDKDTNNFSPSVQTFPLENIDTMREKILSAATSSAPFNVNTQNLTPYSWLLGHNGERYNYLSTQEGLALKTYQSDLLNNWLSTEWIDGPGGITELTAIDTSEGSFTIDTLNLSTKVYKMLNRIAVSGGTYDDWIDAVYVQERYTRCESPMYMGGLSKELVFQEVISNSDTAKNPLGTLGGRGVLAGKHKGGYVHISVDEPSYIIGIVSLTPRLDYSQGNQWHIHLQTMDDFHKPQLDEIGFQELLTEQFAWWDTWWDGTTEWKTRSAGKQPAWINYMTNINRTHGNFATDNEMWMTLNRRYDHVLQSGQYTIRDLTTYIDPVKYNQIFAQTSLDAQNFWTQIAVDITARRKMSAKVMPNL